MSCVAPPGVISLPESAEAESGAQPAEATPAEAPERKRDIIPFSALTPYFPTKRLILEREGQAGPALAARLVQLAQALRRLGDHDLEETVSTRLLVMSARLVASGLGLRAACRGAIVDALTDDADTAAALDEVVRAVVGDAD